jgi:hypothetical protein
MVRSVLGILAYYVLPNMNKSKNHVLSIILSSLSQGCQTIHNQVHNMYIFFKGSPNHYSMSEHSIVNNCSFHYP